ncbi:M23 family metallopeptidase [Bryobacter aggregatus]|uniref:M23 family metallopeptidase n=1 Tax=Bryobacter aggregatus TaxID=360054 RepID=UPI0004E25DEC|nr:M23 family metallopeptidase [Bryobacter aggregatus]
MPHWTQSFLLLVVLGSSAAEVQESFEAMVIEAPAPITVAGRTQLYYELHLTNFSSKPLQLETVRVHNADNGAVLQEIGGAALAARTSILGAVAGPVAPGRRAILYLELDLGTAAPRAIEHEIAYLSNGERSSYRLRGGRSEVSSRQAIVVGMPVSGGPWVAVHHPDWARGHRRVVYTVEGRPRIPGRFAIDWVKVDALGRTIAKDSDRVDAAFGYDAAALAVADAVVVAIRNDFAESSLVSQNPKHALGEGSGNYVVLQLTKDRFAIYEHLRPGSATVAVGDRVRLGQKIGALGFTGDSTGPHLHFHMADGANDLNAEGVPFAFDRFTVLGHYRDISKLGSAPWEPAEKIERKKEWPAPNAVLQVEAAHR